MSRAGSRPRPVGPAATSNLPEGASATPNFADVFAEAPMATALVALEGPLRGRLTHVNRALCELTGHAREQLLGATLQDLRLPGDDDGDDALLACLASDEAREATLERRILDAQGHVRWTRLDASVGGASSGERYAVAHLQDVTEARRQAQSLQAQSAVARLISASATIEGALAAVVPALGEAFECDFAAAWVRPAAEEVLRCQTLWRPSVGEPSAFADLTRRIALERGIGVAGRAWEAEEPVWVEDLVTAPGMPRARAAAREGLHGAVAFPIFVGQRFFGVVELIARGLGESNPAMHALLAEFGEQLGGFAARKEAEMRVRPSPELLLVEDNNFIVRLVRDMLAGSGLELRLDHVDRLSAARERLLAGTPACVLLDLTLPDADGLEALLELRQLAPDVPIVVLTAHEDDDLAVRAVQEGAQDYLVKRKVALSGVAQSVRYAIERKRAEQQVLEYGLHDRVTGLPNRGLFLDRLRVALARGGHTGAQVGVLVVNLDRFRLVNDSLGYEEGDRLLADVAARLREATDEEADGVATVASFGGDEFGVLWEGQNDLAATALAERLLGCLSIPVRVSGQDVTVSAAVGVALDAGLGAEALVRDAETALTRAKELGGARFEVFDETVRRRIQERVSVEKDLRSALENDQLRVLYQPIWSIGTGEVVAMEALLRWEHPDRGSVSPMEFIPLAEESGLIVPIGEWVLRESARQLARWAADERSPEGLRVNVNLSARQVADPAILCGVEEAIAEAGIRPDGLCLEVTESSLMEDVDASVAQLHALRDLGVSLALDDFGTGYSSLSYLQRFPVDVLKLDRSFVSQLGDGPATRAIPAAVVDMAAALELVPLAEGVESEEQLRHLRALGYEHAQGWYFHGALLADAAGEILDRGPAPVGASGR